MLRFTLKIHPEEKGPKKKETKSGQDGFGVKYTHRVKQAHIFLWGWSTQAPLLAHLPWQPSAPWL